MIDKNDPRLTDFVLGELSPVESAEVQDAIDNSEELQAAVEEIRQTASLLGAAYQTEEPLHLLDEQKAELAQTQIDEASRELKRATGGRSWLPIVLAASLLGVLVGGAIYFQDPPVSPEVADKMARAGGMTGNQLDELESKASSVRDLKLQESDGLAREKSAQDKPGAAGEQAFKAKTAEPSSENGKRDERQMIAADLSPVLQNSIPPVVVEGEEIQQIVDDFNLAVDEQRFAEAELLAKKAVEVAPESEIVAVLNEKANLLRRIDLMQRTSDAKEEGFWAGIENGREASIGIDDNEAKSDQELKFVQESFQENSPVRGGFESSRGMESQGLRSAALGNVDPNANRITGESTIVGRDPSDDSGASDRFGEVAGLSQEQLQSAGGKFGGGDDGRGFAAGGGAGGGFGGSDEDAEMVAGSSGMGFGGGRGGMGGNPGSGLGTGGIEVDGSGGGMGRGMGGDPGSGQAGEGDSVSIPEGDAFSLRSGVTGGVRVQSLSPDDANDAIEAVLDETPSQSAALAPYREPQQELTRLMATKLVDNKLAAAPMTEPVPTAGGNQLADAAKDHPESAIPGVDSEGKNAVDGQPIGDFASETGKATGRAEQMLGQQRSLNAPANLSAESEKELADKRMSGDDGGESKFNAFALAGEEGADVESNSKPSSAQQELAEMEQLGFRLETRMRREQKTRNVPIRRTRPEVRERTVELGDGTTKQENYTVEVPYTDNVTQSYFVEVPEVVVDIEPETTDRMVEELVRRINPSGSREIVIEELFEKTREMTESLESDEEETDEDLMLAIILREQIVEGASGKRAFDVTPALKQVNKALAKRNAKIRKARTWKRVKAIPNTTRLMLGDKTELDLTGMQVNVQVDGFRARVLLDYFYYNDRNEQLEGNFKLRLPDDSSLYYFAFGESAYNLNPKGKLAAEEFMEDGTQFVSLGAEKIRDARQDAWKNVKESKMVPREKAAHAYRETVRQKVDPALVEWSGAGVFNARVFPIAPKKLHRIVIGYDVNLKKVDGSLIYELELPKQTGQCQVDLNVQPVDGVEYTIEPKSDPAEHIVAGEAQRLYRFEGPQKETIRLTASKSPEMLLQSDEGFWGIQVTPELPVEHVAGNPRAVFLVDTSLSSNPDKFNVWLKLLESTLESNRDSLKQFNVVFFNVDANVWQEKWVENSAENVQSLMEKCDTLALEGATDLYGAIEKISKSVWMQGSEKDVSEKPMAGPDLFLLSDGAANWGETNLRLISRQLQDHQLGSLFAYQTGLTGTAISELRFLAGESGGAVFSVASEDEIKIASTAHRKRPWKLASITATGASDIMTAGRTQWVYPGQAITVVGRGDVEKGLKLELEQAGQVKSVSVTPKRIKSELASRLYGQVAVGQLESLGAEVFDVASSYARHFRVTGDTCSLLMLESEAEYKRFDIKPHEDLFVIKTKEAKDLVADTLQRSADELADPKAQLLAWMTRLETMPGMSFKMPTALKLAMDDIEVVAISQPLNCSVAEASELSKEYLNAIQNERLDYEVIAAEANRRGRTSVDDAIKVFSSLVERNPGDLVIARDVAYTALEMGRPAQAYHLLKSVARARPFEGSIYPALGQCLTQLGQSDMAIVYYEIALGGSFNRVGDDFQKIVSAEYMYLLRQIGDGELDSSVKAFAQARLETLKKNLHFESADLLITMMWNTDQTDVDLHIVEPSGEECSYENKKTRSGGQITSDITTGFGPEMYSNPDAPSGKYDVQVKYFASNQNRTELQNKVHLTIYRGFGTPNERLIRKTVQLKKVGEKESVATVGVD